MIIVQGFFMQKGTQMTDEQYMRRAIELAKRGMGYTSPNPMVGAVVVKDGRIIGEGWHERYGELHAERNALKHCKESPQGADNLLAYQIFRSSQLPFLTGSHTCQIRIK